jgi:hypothetical protein
MEFYNTNETNIYNIIKDKTKQEINIDSLKIGDYVYISFIPDSQKYIYDLTSKLGKVIKIDNIDKEFPDITILNYENESEDLLHGCCSYYGQSLGYSYSLYLIKN